MLLQGPASKGEANTHHINVSAHEVASLRQALADRDAQVAALQVREGLPFSKVPYLLLLVYALNLGLLSMFFSWKIIGRRKEFIP